MYQLILIERYLHNSIFWPNLIKDKRIEELTVDQILDKYQGFEGQLIFHFSTDDYSSSVLNKKINECIKIRNSHNYKMLHLISNSSITPDFIKEKTFQIGFDVGVCDNERTIYSSIFNEILFGHLNELIFYKNLLNENLLFPDRSSAETYLGLHNELSAQGKGVEDYEEMTIYEIRKQKNESTPFF